MDGRLLFIYREQNWKRIIAKLTPLDSWIKRGQNDHFVVKRLKNANQLLTPGNLVKMKKVGETFKGKDYDLYLGGRMIKYIVRN